jgi:hypothetical protein
MRLVADLSEEQNNVVDIQGCDPLWICDSCALEESQCYVGRRCEQYRGHSEQFFVDQHGKSQIHLTGHQLLCVWSHRFISRLLSVFASLQSDQSFLRPKHEASVELGAIKTRVDEAINVRALGGKCACWPHDGICGYPWHQQGEEITVDYGEEWEQAWKAHVLNWDESDYPKEYNGAHDFRDLEVLPAYNEENQELACDTLLRYQHQWTFPGLLRCY